MTTTIRIAQALWLDGLVEVSDAVSARERRELMEVMREKEVNIRTDTYEVMLEAIAEKQVL